MWVYVRVCVYVVYWSLCNTVNIYLYFLSSNYCYICQLLVCVSQWVFGYVSMCMWYIEALCNIADMYLYVFLVITTFVCC